MVICLALLLRKDYTKLMIEDSPDEQEEQLRLCLDHKDKLVYQVAQLETQKHALEVELAPYRARQGRAGMIHVNANQLRQAFIRHPSDSRFVHALK